MTTSFSLRTLSRDDILHHLPALSEILASCVNGGASVSFMLPFAPQTAITFWQRTADSVAAGERIVLAAFDAEERPVGTVQLITSQPENQPHRADVAKLLVHQNARKPSLSRFKFEQLYIIKLVQMLSKLVHMLKWSNKSSRPSGTSWRTS